MGDARRMKERTAVLDQAALEGWGRRVGSAAAAGAIRLPLIVALRGPLGAGKSVLARAVARGAGVSQSMPSPTYNLLFTYEAEAGLRVHHLDLYRLEDPEDVWELGWQELGEGREIVLLEWPERAESLLMPDRWEVGLELVQPAASGSSAGAGSHVDPGLRRVVVRVVGEAPLVVALPGEGEDR